MNVFLSCSGEMSRNVALVLRDWLPEVIQAIKPFISDDIDKGELWFEEITNELCLTTYGIICLTPYNFKAPWINFEAGAISKAIHHTHVTPFLFRIDVSKIRGPLQQFQFVTYTEREIFKLLCSINNSMTSEARLPLELLQKEFDKWWPELRDKLDGLADTQEAETETGFEWLYSAEDLARKQASINCKQIWIITPHLYRRAVHPKVRDIVKRNIERDIHYSFITPTSNKTAEAVKELNRIFAANPTCFSVKDIPEDDFRRLAVTDYVVINPESDIDHPLHVFLELPIESHGYWIEVDNEAAVDFVDRFRQLVEGDGSQGQ